MLSMRLKVPPQINQFVTRTLDKNQAETTFKMLLKYRPEDKKEKKDRLKAEAEARAAGEQLRSRPPAARTVACCSAVQNDGWPRRPCSSAAMQAAAGSRRQCGPARGSAATGEAGTGSWQRRQGSNANWQGHRAQQQGSLPVAGSATPGYQLRLAGWLAGSCSSRSRQGSLQAQQAIVERPRAAGSRQRIVQEAHCRFLSASCVQRIADGCAGSAQAGSQCTRMAQLLHPSLQPSP